MSTEKSCPNCHATMRLETRTPGFQTFECPKCAFVAIEVVKDNAPQGRTVPVRH
jgi:transposase-like protein